MTKCIQDIPAWKSVVRQHSMLLSSSREQLGMLLFQREAKCEW